MNLKVLLGRRLRQSADWLCVVWTVWAELKLVVQVVHYPWWFFCWLAATKIVSFLVYISHQLQSLPTGRSFSLSTTNLHVTLKNVELLVFVCSFYWSLLLVVHIYFNIRMNIFNYYCIKESTSGKAHLVKSTTPGHTSGIPGVAMKHYKALYSTVHHTMGPLLFGSQPSVCSSM